MIVVFRSSCARPTHLLHDAWRIVPRMAHSNNSVLISPLVKIVDMNSCGGAYTRSIEVSPNRIGLNGVQMDKKMVVKSIQGGGERVTGIRRGSGVNVGKRLFSTCCPCWNRDGRSEKGEKKKGDPRIKELGRAITDDYRSIRAEYATPKNPIVLAHGLLGFDELHILGNGLGLQNTHLGKIHYWRGITDALRANGVEVITTTVPASGSIEERAAELGKQIREKAHGKSVNIIAHSMGGLDARYMISRLKPENVEVLSLTTIATPHRGSAFADVVFNELGSSVPFFYRVFHRMGIPTGAFDQLTRKYLTETFNPQTPDLTGVRYFSYGATYNPRLTSVFHQSGKIIAKEEGVVGEDAPNDGLVSVESSKWGTYKGTLVGVSHLDLINWTNRLRWWWRKWMWGGKEGRKFNAIAFYLDIADMLAKEGL